MRNSVRALALGRLRGLRAWAGRLNKVIAAGTALVVVVAVTVVAVLIASPRPPGPPVQQSGTAAGLPHRVPASVTMARLVNGTVVPAHATKGRPAGAAAGGPPAVKRPRGAVPAASRPPRPKLGVRAAQGHDRLRALPPSAARPVRGFDARTSRAVPAGTSASQVTYQNADGTKTAMIYQSPVNYRRPDGSWARIDSSLIPVGSQGAATVTPSSGASRVPSSPPPLTSPSPALVTPTPGSPPASGPASATPSLASSPPAPPTPAPDAVPSSASAPSSAPGQAPAGWRERSAADPATFAPYADGSPLAVLPLGGSHSVGFATAGAAHVAGTAGGDAVIYPNASPGADLRLVAGAGMVDEQLVLHSASAPHSWVFPLRLNGLHALTGPGGVIEFADPAGKVLAVMPNGLMTDSKTDPHSGNGAVSAGVTYTLTTAGGRAAITMSLDTSWLDAPARVFPVTVDPSVSSVNSNGTTYVLSPFNSDFSGDPEIDVGTYDGGANVGKAFLKFDSVSSALAHDNVLGVRLGLFNSWSYSCSPRGVSVYPVTSPWSAAGAKSYPGPSTGPAIGSKSFATGWVPLGSTASPCPAAWEGINLGAAGTQLVNGWTHGTTPNNGLALGASTTDSYAWKKFTSHASTNGDPFLSVTYTPDGARYALASPRPVQQVTPNSGGAFAIKVTNTGAATWTPTNGYELSYEAYNSAGRLVANHPVFTPMPSSVPPGASVTVNAKVNALPVGRYAINFDMYSGATGSSPVSFLSQGIAPLPVGLYVPQPPPVVTGVYPPTGYISSTVTPELSTTAFSTIGTAITYKFSLTCQPLPGTTCPASTVTSGTLSVPYWTPPPLTWNEPYIWTVTATTNGASTSVGPVTITPQVPQPAITSGLGGSAGQAFDAQSGNFATSATEAAVAVAGPPLAINRTYNSLDPRAGGAFGAGWSSTLGTAVIPDSDGSGNVVVALADGQQMRFGYSGAGLPYASPAGSPDVLTHDASGTWTLMDASGNQYLFASGGQVARITDRRGLTQSFTSNSSAEVTTVTDAASGRALHLTWSIPAGAAHPHVASVTSDPPASGQSGLTWTYSYTGDDLTGVCAPSGNCSQYTYAGGSHYQSAVLDSAPRSYWQFGDASGSASAADEVDANLGTTDGTYANVTLGAPGLLAGSSETAASFNGTSSSVSLPANLLSDQNYVSVGIWFKAANSTASGVLFGYQADALSNSAGNNAPHVPALYVGGNGRLYGELWNGSVDPMVSPASVDDGNWHYAVLTGSGTSQALWLDGTQVATLAGQISATGLTNDTVGAGFWGGGWPNNYATQGASLVHTPIGYFAGSIGQAAVYPHPLGQPAISGQYALAAGASAELTQVTLPSGRIHQQAAYDSSRDRLATYTDAHGGQWQIHAPLATGYKPTSDSLGQVTRSVTVVDPAGHNRVYGYDALNGGRLVSYTPGNGDAPQAFGYDAAGVLNQTTDSDGNIVSLTNDIHGNVLSRTWYPVGPGIAGAASTNRMGPQAAASSCTTTGAACTTYYAYYYNTANPLDPRNNEQTAVRDARSASATDNTYLTSSAYNAAGELTSSTTAATSDFPSGRTTSDVYSTASTAAYGGGTAPAGLLISQTTAGGAVTAYSYYPNGDLAQVTKPNGLRTVYAYDALGRPLTATAFSDAYPSGLTTSYAYNGLGQPVTVTHPAVSDPVTGVTHTRQDSSSYDADGNLTQRTQSDLTGGDAARTTSYTYNDHGEVASVTGPAGATSGGTAPPQGAPSANPTGATTGYTYDDSGHVATMVDANGNEYGYTYNEYGKATQVTLTSNSTSQSNPGGGASLVLDSFAYDPAGLLAAATDAMGRTTNYFYNGNRQLIATQNLTSAGTGRQTAYTYDGAGNLIEKNVSNDPVTQQTITDYNIDPAGRLSSAVVDPTPAGTSASGYANRTTSYTYNADNAVTASTATGAGGSSTTLDGYNSSGELTSQTVQNGPTNLITTWTYNQLGQPTSMTTPDGNAAGATAANFTTNYAYNEAGGLAFVTGPPLATQSYAAPSPVTTRPVTSYGYDTFGDRTEAENPAGGTTKTAYDGAGRVTSLTMPAYTPPGSTTPITATTSNAYDGLGHLTKVTDPLGNATSYTYDALGDVISRTDPQLTGQSAPGVWNFSYDNVGEQLSATSPAGAQTQATYDRFGERITSTQDIRGASGTAYNTTATTYDYLGDPLTVTSPDGAVTTHAYDHLGELASSTNGFGNTTSYAYDYAGQPAQVTHPDGTSDSFTHDAAGNLTATTAYGTSVPPAIPPVLATQKFGYDPSGNLTSSTDPAGNTTSHSYDAAGELTSTSQPVSASVSNTTSYGYDPAGNQTAITSGRGNTTWTSYNPWKLPESVIEPATTAAPAAAQRTWTTSYNAAGQAASVTQPGGITLAYGHDQLGNLTSETGSGAAAATPAQSFGYDTSGQLVSASAPGGTDTFGYDDAGHLTTTTGPSGNATFTYNGDGLMTGRTDAAGAVGYAYDQADRLATVADPLTGSTLTYGYNANSRPSSVSYATGGTAGPVRSYAYNGLHQLTGDTLTAAGGAPIASAAYGYNANGDMTSQATTGYAGAGSTSYGYNQADQLTSSTSGGSTTSYGYDADGNLTQAGTTSYSYNAQDQLTSSAGSAGSTSYAYTLSGMLSSATPPSGTAQNYTSNAYGQTATAPGGISYSYDALGRLTTRTTSTANSALAYSGAGSTLASDGTTNYSYSPSGRLVGIQPSGGTAQSALTNLHGDVTGAFSPAAGTSLTASAAYSPYGTVTATSGSMPALGYQGQYTDPSTKNVDMSARWYSPATGGFTSNDTVAGAPLPSTADGNPYGYAGGNPLTTTDPTGHFCMPALGGPTIFCPPDPQPQRPPVVAQPPIQTPSYPQIGWNPLAQWAELAQQAAAAAAQQFLNPFPMIPFPAIQITLPFQNNGGGNGGGGPSGGCVFNCFVPPWFPPIQLPPPPPPQDKYTGPDPAAVPPAPPWLRNDPFLTHIVHDTTNPSGLFNHGIHINEPIQLPHNHISGTSPSDNPATSSSSNGNQQPLCDDPLTSFVKDAVANGVVAGAGALLDGAISQLAAQSGIDIRNTPAYQGAMAEVNVAQTLAAYDNLVRGGGGDSCGSNSPPGSPKSPDPAGTSPEAHPGNSGAASQATSTGAGGSADGAAPCPGQSFTGDTRVLLASGKAIPIAQLKPGDKVLATNTRTGKTKAEPVAAVLLHHDTDLYDLSVKVGMRTATIQTTASHLFWEQATRRWTKAAALRPGDELRTPAGPTATVLGGHTPKAGAGWMWDLTVTSDHDFYVHAAADILVHNCPMIGEGGTQVTSRTLTMNNDYRIDVENPNPGVRPGQLHLQDSAGNKYQYNFDTGQFEGLPKSLAKQVAKDPAVARAIATGRRYLGMGP